MPRRCLVCLSSDRPEIDEALVTGTPFRNVSKRHGLSVASLFRHRKEHISAALVKVEETRQEAEAESLFDKVKAIEADVHRLKAKAEADGDLRAALVACDRALDVVKLYGAVKPSSITPEMVAKMSDQELDAALVKMGVPPVTLDVKRAVHAAYQAAQAERAAVPALPTP